MNKNTQILTQSAQYLKGVGPKKIKSLNKLSIATIKDVLYYFPRRYEDRSNFINISKISIGKIETVRGRVLTMSLRRLRGKRTIFHLAVGDETGVIYGTWFNQPYLKNFFKINDHVILHGKVDFYHKLQINSPEYEILQDDDPENTIHTGRIVPIYPLTADVSQRYLRRIIKYCVDNYAQNIQEFLPETILKRNNLLTLGQSLLNIHFPESDTQLKTARKRLIFDEFFLLQLALAIKRKDVKTNKNGISYKIEGKILEKFKKSLPFELTGDQQKVMAEIESDMASCQPMNRLLQGDVGSGKTVVCVHAALICLQNNYQAALMAPTEILAQQHDQTIRGMLKPLGFKTVCLTSSLKKKEKKSVLAEIENQAIDFIIGTHALIQAEVKFKKLGLIIVDEQHKFGVLQREKLLKKSITPDVLVMSATPIPRTLAITVYGDLDISTIRELPPERNPVKTYWISEKKRKDFYTFLKQKIKEKNQVYVVYPVIEKSKSLDLKAATKMFEQFKDKIFPEYKVGLVHGKMTDSQKKQVMGEFKKGKIDILVATTVIEVGIDVPNASIILIEHAERFGLSQLHQLRGRVGRGKKQAFCVLLSSGKSEDSQKRLSAMIKTTDGFKIAEYDLLIRGPGEFFGTRQSGLPELKLGNIINDKDALILARKEAFSFMQEQNLDYTSNFTCITEMLDRFSLDPAQVMSR
ncbi:MAG: ATP-dependent DNA helicase RecG [Candidatus Omnitrophota bacterium]